MVTAKTSIETRMEQKEINGRRYQYLVLFQNINVYLGGVNTHSERLSGVNVHCDNWH